MVGDSSFTTLSAQQRLDVVVQFNNQGRATALWHQELCWVEGLSSKTGETWTLYDAMFQGLTPKGHVFEVDQQTRAFRKPCLDFKAFTCMKEVCAGIGGISMGFAAAGVAEPLHSLIALTCLVVPCSSRDGCSG